MAEPEKPMKTVTFPRKQWQQMERFRKGETQGDVVVLPRKDAEPPRKDK